MNSNIIIVEDACKEFKNHVLGLNNVNVAFEQGKIHGIIGRNGSGKTVLFKVICGFMKLSSGSVSVNGKIVGKDVDIPPNVGIIIEAPGFLPGYSGLANLKLLASLRHKIGIHRIRETMEIVGLDPSSSKKVRNYSLGMRQRLGIAQAIMEDPDILILDEPMNGLDLHGVDDVRKLLVNLKEQGKTILMASHSREDIETLCDTVTEMDAGKLIGHSIHPA